MPEKTTPPATTESADLKYPIGGPSHSLTFSTKERRAAIDILSALPAKLAAAVGGLSDAQLDTPYRADGWTIRQLVHHIADSHVTVYSWVRLALTDDWPLVFDYDPATWAGLNDASLPVEFSLKILEGVQARLVALFDAMTDAQWTEHGYTHPESGRCPLEQVLAMYAWHARHHLAHIVNCRQRNGW